MKFKIRAKNSRGLISGFTLIEMIIAVAVFTVVMTITMSAFLNLSSIQKKAFSVRASNDNMNFALEMMSRSARTGSGYSSAWGSSQFSFTDVSGNSVVYRLNGTQIEVSKSGGAFLPLTASEAEITELKFFVRGEGSNDGQPIVLIILNGRSGKKEKNRSYLNLQTMVTQRKIDVNK